MGHVSTERRWRAFPRWLLHKARAAIGDAEQPKLWFMALALGVASGYTALGFWWGVSALNNLWLGAVEGGILTAASDAHPALLIAGPAFGGLLVGLLMRAASGEKRPLGVADVIAARALSNARIDVRCGAASTLAAVISLGFGASAGREGPVVVAGAAIASKVSDLIRANPTMARTMLGCSVAAAVSASFNAPIAGALFALEVVLGHYAVRAFAPITIASVAGAVISRAHFGDDVAFSVPFTDFGSYAQFPAFFLLGLFAAAMAIAMMWSIIVARDVASRIAERLRLPIFLMPMVAGALVGVIAFFAPEVIGVGYETTTDALSGRIDFWACIFIAVAKTVAVAITQAGRFAGGVFSPALVLGALMGSAFGLVATDVFPSVSGSQTLYTLAGMGAVAGAVLGAPISTTLIIFELTGDYGTAIAVMVSTSVATVATQQIFQKSYFHFQLMERGLDLGAGPQTYLLPSLKVAAHMRPRGADDGGSESTAWQLVEQGAHLDRDDGLDKALQMFRQVKTPFLPVVAARSEGQGRTLIGTVFHIDALRAYNRALVENYAEEHS